MSDAPAFAPPAEAIARAAALLAVMAHPARLQVLHALHIEGPMTAGALQTRVGLEASALSHQLRVLREAHLVRVVPDGRHRIYTLDDPHVVRLVDDALAHTAESRPALTPTPAPTARRESRTG